MSKMKVLLVNPPRENSIYSEVPTTVNAEINSIPPLGLLYLESHLAHHTEHEAKIIDCQADSITHAGLEQIIRDENPHLVGVTGHTHDLVDILAVSKMVKRVHPEIAVWWGGPHVTSFPRESMHFPEVDGAIPKEGEVPFTEVVETLSKGGDLSQVKGILFRRKGEVVQTPPAPTVNDLDSLPMPRREILDVKKYYYLLGDEVTATSLISSRGCPYNCNFCNTPGRKTWRHRSARNVVDEMEACVRLGIKEIYFVDDTFNVDRERIDDICHEIIRRGLEVRWNFRARVNLLRAEQLTLLEKAGCTRIHVGVEAGNNEGMKGLRKQLTVDKVKDGFKLLKKTKMHTVCYFMIGSPHERTREDIMETIDFAIDLDPDYVLFGIMTPYPDTDIFRDGVKKGILDPDHWQRFILDPKPGFKPQMWTEHMSEDDLNEMLEIAFKRFYIRPKLLFKKLIEIRNIKDFGRKLKAGWSIAKL